MSLSRHLIAAVFAVATAFSAPANAQDAADQKLEQMTANAFSLCVRNYAQFYGRTPQGYISLSKQGGLFGAPVDAACNPLLADLTEEQRNSIVEQAAHDVVHVLKIWKERDLQTSLSPRAFQ
jgi:hypothetical protein